jgi:hypothetical protein
MSNAQSARCVDTTLTLKVGRRPAATLTCATLITTDCGGQVLRLEPPDALGQGDGEDVWFVAAPMPNTC